MARAVGALAVPDPAPGTPTGLTATAGNGEVQLSWTALASNGGSALQTYTVTGNGVGDNDPASGSISDPFAPLLVPAPGGAAAIPTLSQWGLMLMSLLAAALGMGALRRRGV